MNRKNPLVVFLLPFLVYMIAGAFEPQSLDKPGGGAIGLSIPYDQYPLVYALKICLTLAAMIFVLSGYLTFSGTGPEGNLKPATPVRFSKILAVGVGVLGIVIWIALCKLDIEHRYIRPFLANIGLGGLIGAGDRSGFNPFKELNDLPLSKWTFLVVRFAGLALVVPVIEEMFLRGFVMRFVIEKDWWKVPFGTASRLAIVLGTTVPLLTHPSELLAAAVWFSMVTWLMLRTKNIWDCILAHAVTNFLLGLYVVWMGGEAWRMM
jgi:CAAX prenyl protease-like protein